MDLKLPNYYLFWHVAEHGFSYTFSTAEGFCIAFESHVIYGVELNILCHILPECHECLLHNGVIYSTNMNY